MRLSPEEETVFDTLVRSRLPLDPGKLSEQENEVLRKAEVGSFFHVQGRVAPQSGLFGFLVPARDLELSLTPPPIDVVFREDAAMARLMIESLRKTPGMTLHVLVARSWVCYHNCNGVIASDLCEEEREDTNRCGKRLVERCH